MLDENGESRWALLRFELMWTEHGGSGLGMGFNEVDNLDLQDAIRLNDLMRDRKQREADAIKRARG